MITDSSKSNRPDSHPKIHEMSCILWIQAKGDQSLRLDYNLDQDSLVFDIGGFEGNWSQDIFSRYGCQIHVFEPVQSYADQIEAKFTTCKKVTIHRFGLSGRTERILISVAADGSSIFKEGTQKTEISLTDIVEFIQQHKITKIDLIKINIEGAEYDLLDRLIGSGLINIVENIQVQFHDFVPLATERMQRIQNRLRETHFLTYQYEFVWENWKKKKSSKSPEIQKDFAELYAQLETMANELRITRKEHIEGLLKFQDTSTEAKEARQKLEHILQSRTYKLGFYIQHPHLFLAALARKTRQRLLGGT